MNISSFLHIFTPSEVQNERLQWIYWSSSVSSGSSHQPFSKPDTALFTQKPKQRDDSNICFMCKIVLIILLVSGFLCFVLRLFTPEMLHLNRVGIEVLTQIFPLRSRPSFCYTVFSGIFSFRIRLATHLVEVCRRQCCAEGPTTHCQAAVLLLAAEDGATLMLRAWRRCFSCHKCLLEPGIQYWPWWDLWMESAAWFGLQLPTEIQGSRGWGNQTYSCKALNCGVVMLTATFALGYIFSSGI